MCRPLVEELAMVRLFGLNRKVLVKHKKKLKFGKLKRKHT